MRKIWSLSKVINKVKITVRIWERGEKEKTIEIKRKGGKISREIYKNYALCWQLYKEEIV